MRQIVDLATPLEGLVRQDSIHAAGVVIGDRPLTEYVPLQQKGADQEVVTQFPMGDVEALGLLKMDFLGLRNLDVIDKARRARRRARPRARAARRPEDVRDAPARRVERRLPVRVLGDARGAPAGEADRVRGPDRARRALPAGADGLHPGLRQAEGRREQVSYLDDRLRPITEPTYGICIYQEQYMEIAKQLAGFSPAEADDLRKAIGKKIHSLMASLKDKFLEGCAANGVTPAVANQLWKDMEQAQDYSFNKSHAACYALIAYRTAYLKANHPAEYMAALISSVMNTKDKVPFYVAACDEMGIEVLPPDVNVSQADFAVVEGKIRFGLNAVKNVGESAARAIVGAREEGGPFESVWDFAERVDPQLVNKRALEALAKCGALGSTGATRKGLLENECELLDRVLGWGVKAQADRLSGQGSIFDLGGDERGGPAPPPDDPGGRVRQEDPPPAREGVARALRVRAPARRRARAAAAARSTAGFGARAASRRRGRDGRWDRRGAQAADDEEGRADGLPAARRPLRVHRDRGLQLGVRVGARAPRRPTGCSSSRVGSTTSRRGDEAGRDGGRALRGDAGAERGAAQGGRAEGPRA